MRLIKTQKYFRKSNLEDEELIAFFQYVSYKALQDPVYRAIWHVANERKSSWAAGKYLKKKGVKSGVSDITVAIPAGEYHGLFIELKVGKNTLSESQAEFLSLMQSLGYKTLVCYSASEAIDALEDYLKSYKSKDKL